MKALQDLERRYPEWRPWLAQVGELLDELGQSVWDAAVPPLPSDAAQGEAALVLRAGLDPDRAPIPLLHACRRRWREAVPKAWARGYCPVCGGWPAFAETCGVERNRYLRCVRCGSAWRAHGLACPFCANADHQALGSLVPEDGKPAWAIETCSRCRGYLKSFTRLSVSDPVQALLEDLGSVELDLAAEQRGFRRPRGSGDALHVAA